VGRQETRNAATGYRQGSDKAPERPAPVVKPASAKTEVTVMSTDAMRPLSTTPSGSTARLGASLHVKGEISGNEDLHIDGSVEGLVQLDDRKLTVAPAPS